MRSITNKDDFVQLFLCLIPLYCFICNLSNYLLLLGEKIWNYCSTKDRRFYEEILEGLSLNGPFLLINSHTKKLVLPPNLYDCGSGFYDLEKNMIFSSKTGEEIRSPDEKEKNWIIKNCRIGI